MTDKVIRFIQISGLCGKTNDLLLFSRTKLSDLNKLVLFFHGDIQNYEEEMHKYQNSKDYVKWNLENSIRLIADKFPQHAILAVKCSKMMTPQLARYCNFIDYDEDDLVKYRRDFDALQHLEQLILNLKREIEFNSDYQNVGLKVDSIDEIAMVGFSKGGVVLNQILISLYELQMDLDRATRSKLQNSIDALSDDQLNNSFLSRSMSSSCSQNFGGLTGALFSSFSSNRMFFDIFNDAVNSRLNAFYKKLTKLIWLIWYILNDSILENAMDLNLEIQIHSTPRQINCYQRPHIGRQEREFSEKFENYNKFKRKHYLQRPASLENHFRILEDFDPS